MKRLYVLYDAECAFCRRCRVWLAQQPAFVPLVFLPLQSPELACRFPGIERLSPAQELLVISDEGEVWHGAQAWIMVLWALREFREWSQRLARPVLLPFARRVCEMVSENRSAISRWFTSSSDHELEQRSRQCQAHRVAAHPRHGRLHVAHLDEHLRVGERRRSPADRRQPAQDDRDVSRLALGAAEREHGIE